jgi:hypothetical protein
MSSLLVFIGWVSHVGIFDPDLCTTCKAPLTFFGSPPLPLPKVKVQYIQKVCGWGGGGGGGELSCVGDQILQEFSTLFLTRFRTYKISLSLQTQT